MAGLCSLCGAQKKRNAFGRFTSRHCDSCEKLKSAERSAARNPCGQAHDYWPICAACETIKREKRQAASRVGIETRRRNHPHMALPLNAEAYWQRRALTQVAAAVKRGILPELDGTVACVDCGRSATVYEHRDYGRPLDVQPTCQSCNRKRGTAIWPSADQFNFARVVPQSEAA